MLGEAAKALSRAARVGHLQRDDPDDLGAAGVVALVELVPPAELRSDRIPQELHELHAIDGFDAARAAQILVEERAQLRRPEIDGVGIQVNEPAREDGLRQLLDARVGDGREHAIRLAVFRVGQHGIAGPGDGRARHGVAEAPEQVAPRDRLADRGLHVAALRRADHVDGLEQQSRDEVELHREPRAALEHRARMETRVREERVGPLDVLVDEHVLPRHENLVEDEDRVVLVEAATERVVERAPHDLRGHRVGRPADELHARRVHGDHEGQREFLLLDRHRARLRHEVVMREGGAGGDDLGAAHDQAGIALLLHVHVHVRDFVRRTVAIDGRVHERVVHVEHALLCFAIPAPRVVLIGRVVVGVRAERGQERGLVVGRAPHPAVGEARPRGDRSLGADQIVHGLRRAEVFVREAAGSRVGLARERLAHRRVVQRVVQARQHAHGIAECRVRRHVLHAFAVDPDVARTAQAVEEFRSGEGSRFHVRRPYHLNPCAS